MSTAELLRVIALLSTWARGDFDAVEIVLDEGRPDMVAHLVEFTLLVLDQNCDGNGLAYLEWLGDQARTLHAQEADR